MQKFTYFLIKFYGPFNKIHGTLCINIIRNLWSVKTILFTTLHTTIFPTLATSSIEINRDGVEDCTRTRGPHCCCPSSLPPTSSTLLSFSTSFIDLSSPLHLLH